MLAMAAMGPDPIGEAMLFATTTVGSLLDGEQFGPIVRCVMGLPGCDGSAKKLV